MPLGEFSQWIVALLFPALTVWSVAAANDLAYPFPHDTLGPPFADWHRPQIFRGRWGEPFLWLLTIIPPLLGLSGIIWMAKALPTVLVFMFAILGVLLGYKVYQWPSSTRFFPPAAIALILGDAGLLVLHWIAWFHLRPA